MTLSIRAAIRAFVARESRLCCSTQLWRAGLRELKRRSEGRRESGAFLLGRRQGARRVATHFIFYDDLDPRCLDTGIVVFDGAGYGPLWQLCRETGRDILADVHTHPGQSTAQSGADRTNPMVALPGHISLIVPDFARGLASPRLIGVYEYQGSHRWRDHSGQAAGKFFYVGIWG